MQPDCHEGLGAATRDVHAHDEAEGRIVALNRPSQAGTHENGPRR